jgi:hypothetical protein
MGMAEEERILERAISLSARSRQCIARAKFHEVMDVQCLERSHRALAKARESLRLTRIGPLGNQRFAWRRQPEPGKSQGGD